MGPTAAGKSEVALTLAEEGGAAIISVDSMQVYREMDVGTAKASPAERARVPHHMIDLVDPADEFTVADFQEAGRAAIAGVRERAAPALIVGGSGLHFRALVDPLDFPPTDASVRERLAGLDPRRAAALLVAADAGAPEHVDMANPRRVLRALEVLELTGDTPSERAAHPRAAMVREYRSELPVAVIGFDPGDRLPVRARVRCDAMVAAGLVEEVARLRDRLGVTAGQAVGYKEMLPVVAGRSTLAEGRARVVRATLALAKRQRTFFRRDPRVRWLPWSDDPGERAATARLALEEAAWTS